ncbi:MAG: hypothetical protein LBS33_00470 [Streptococcaceae bacterium]|jgi:hypothetical protein|nr:hypothetical protein [Streptococcaceae bacterium]
MSRLRFNKRKIIIFSILFSISSIGIFAGTYAKYTSEISSSGVVTDNFGTNVVLWNVGMVMDSTHLFDKIYSGNLSDTSKKSEALALQLGDDKAVDSLVAGTWGYKIIRLTNQNFVSKDTKKVTFATKIAQPTDSHGVVRPILALEQDNSELDQLLLDKIQFAILVDPTLLGRDGPPVITDTDGVYQYTQRDDKATSIALPLQNGLIAASGDDSLFEHQLLAINASFELDFPTNAVKTHDIVIVWRRSADSELEVPNDKLVEADSSRIPNLTISFGTAIESQKNRA